MSMCKKKKHARGAKNAWQEGSEEEGTEDTSSAGLKNLRNRVKPRRWNSELLEVYKCDSWEMHEAALVLMDM